MAQPAALAYEEATWHSGNALDDGGNRLLRDLPEHEAAIVQENFERVKLESMEEIAAPGDIIEWVHFPDTAVISLITVVNSHGIEALTVGRDGMGSLPLIAGAKRTFVRIVCQIPGEARRVSAETFMDVLGNMPELQRRLSLYSQLAFDVTSQSAACNRVHVTEARCARWLLMSQDRAGRDEFKLTQHFLSQMLGVRRPAVTVAVGTLERGGFIAHRRGRIKITDRPGLERAACECYSRIRERQRELLGF